MFSRWWSIQRPAWRGRWTTTGLPVLSVPPSLRALIASRLDLLPEEAPLTVDNFIKLANSGYFNGVEVHRVVANFVMLAGLLLVSHRANSLQ